MDLRLHLSSRKVTRSLLLVTAVLFALHLVGVLCHLVLKKRVEAFTMLFDVDLEANLPTYFNSLLFFLCAALMWLTGRGHEGVLRRGWYVLAGVFFFLGIDEGSQIHEKFMFFTLRLLNHGAQTGVHMGWLYYAWVIPYGAAAILLMAVLGRWLFNVDGVIRKGLFLSGTVYLFGAVFMEMLSGKVAEDLTTPLTTAQATYMPCEIYIADSCHLYVDPAYVTIYTVEELCEILGLILGAHVITTSLEKRNDLVEVRFGSDRTA